MTPYIISPFSRQETVSVVKVLLFVTLAVPLRCCHQIALRWFFVLPGNSLNYSVCFEVCML